MAGKRPSLSVTLLIANLIHLSLTFSRGDTVLLLAGWRLDSWLAILFAIVGLFLLQYSHLQNSTQESKE